MIRMIESRAAGHAKSYFSDALAKSDYYTSDQELEGFWQGKLASRLGLSGAMDRDVFFALCENVHPQTGGHLTPRTKEERRVGYDINFHCPKSVSILHSLSGDDHILNAFRASVTETMQAIEADAQARVRKDGAFTNRPTGELVWGHFVHQTARPVEGHLPDPHLHSHCFVFNATWDETEQRYKAGEFGDIKRDMPYYQARFQKTLSDKLATLGYAIQKTAKGFEIGGVPQEAIDLFSKRTDEIGRVAKEKGITDAKELGELGARTRAKKQKAVSMSDLKREWLKEINALPIDAETATKPVRHATPEDTPSLTASECLDFALLHSFERASVLADRRVLAAAYRHSIGHAGASVEAITEAFKGDKRIIHVPDKGRTVCTTREVLAEEKRMVQLARQGQGKLKSLYSEAPDTGLAGQQAEAAAHVLTTPHRVSIIRGVAGAGKTTLLKAFAKKVEEAGHSLTVVAPTSQASRGVLREEGFGTAETVAKLLTDERMQQNLQGQVLVVDEAGLLGTKDMTALLELATQKNARLVLVGDTRQHASVVRGDALRILNTVGGIRSAEVSKIYRQTREEYRAAVTDLSQGYIREAFEKLDGLDFIRELDPINPNEEIVNAYMDAVVKGRSALVVSPTHAQGEAVTAAIRDRLKAEGILGGKDSTVYRLQTANLTVAEKSDARNYQKGQVVQFSQNVTGFRRGSRWTVAETDGKTVTLQNDKGETKPLPIEHSGRYEVYNPRDLALAKGDAVLITNNGFDQTGRRLNNGTMLTVERIDKNGLIVLRQPQSHEQYLLPKDFGHITHAHCITSYASQGKTVDEVFIYQPAATFPATDAKQFYVSVSRGRTKAHIYTDDKEELLHHASEMGERKSALEVLGINKMKIDFDGRKERQEQEKTKTKPRTKTKGHDHDFIR